MKRAREKMENERKSWSMPAIVSYRKFSAYLPHNNENTDDDYGILVDYNKAFHKYFDL